MQREKASDLHRALLRWYRDEGRKFPWRGTRDPYRILVSEIMLQQTQTSRVHEKYPLFLKRFPTIRDLARAQRRSVVLAWRGMGYNNRAVRLHQLAKAVVTKHSGTISDDVKTLLALPGIGPYTANALLSFAFHRNVPLVETNLRRVFSRLLLPMRRTSDLMDIPRAWEIASELLPERRSADWNQGLMDLGATVCTARKPRCGSCPVSRFCASVRSMRAPASSIPKSEPSFKGVPNRIHRGRIIELLRNTARGRGIRVSRLGSGLHAGFGQGNMDWLRSLLGGLERDGLVRISRGKSVKSEIVRLA